MGAHLDTSGTAAAPVMGMRLTSLLLIVAGSVAAVGCASSSHDDGESDSAESMTGIPNTMNLRMEYDVPSSTIRATVGQTLAVGDQLRLQIRRGRLPQNTVAYLDCSKLPVAPAMALSAAGFQSGVVAAVSGYTPSPTYQGPLVDPSLLATVYNAEWIEAHVSAAGLAELQTEGADSIVEACIMGGGGTYARAKVQTTIANAWNGNDPILQGHTITHPGSATASTTTDSTE